MHWLAILSYAYPAPHKTGVGRSNPICKKATQDAASVFFVVRHMRHFMAWCAIHPQGLRCRPAGLLTHHAARNGAVCVPYAGLTPFFRVSNSTSHRRIMVALAGQPQGWPVSFLPGIATPVNVTAPIERSNSGGDSLTSKKEAVTMVNANPCPCPLFVWRFFSCQQSTYHTVTATSEHEARAQLPDAPCLFAARIRTEEVHHA
ncbi:host cell division inhibitor Icd-like protein [Salmonella enterica]